VRDEGTDGPVESGGRRIEFALIGLLVLAVGFMLVDSYVLEDSDRLAEVRQTASTVGSVAETPTPIVVEESRDVLPNSVAVLPFENLSPDPDNAYFAAGIHEEVLNQLAKIDALNIIARTSMLQYADQTKSIPEIADELNVETVMEGSVRFADDRVLVTAQLIDPVTNSHLWSESYNREFADIFAIQADIAMNIANALEAEFSLEEQAQIEELPTDSPEGLRTLSQGDTGDRGGSGEGLS
jgi:TolB-like protein